MEGEKLTRLLRITFTLAETRQRKLEELERAIRVSRVPSRGASFSRSNQVPKDCPRHVVF
jgi:hypothetical protein